MQRKNDGVARLAIFGSGAGSTASAIIADAGHGAPGYRVVVVVTSVASAGIAQVAADAGIPCICIDARDQDVMALRMIEVLDTYRIDAVALAGWLRLVPPSVIDHLHGAMVNTHPALLPDFGGHGMYGMRVHRAVIEAGVRESGATVHLVSDRYDEGAILGAQRVEVLEGDTPEVLMERVKAAERVLYPRVLRTWIATLPADFPLKSEL